MMNPNIPRAPEFRWWHIMVFNLDGSYKTHEDLLTEDMKNLEEAKREAVRLLHAHAPCTVTAIKYQVIDMDMHLNYSPGDA